MSFSNTKAALCGRLCARSAGTHAIHQLLLLLLLLSLSLTLTLLLFALLLLLASADLHDVVA